MERQLHCRALRLRVYKCVADGRCLVDDFLQCDLQAHEEKRMEALLLRAADHGPPRNTERWRQLHTPGEPLYELKSGQARILASYDGPGEIVLTHGFKKKSGSTPRAQIERAAHMRDRLRADRRDRRWRRRDCLTVRSRSGTPTPGSSWRACSSRWPSGSAS